MHQLLCYPALSATRENTCYMNVCYKNIGSEEYVLQECLLQKNTGSNKYVLQECLLQIDRQQIYGQEKIRPSAGMLALK